MAGITQAEAAAVKQAREEEKVQAAAQAAERKAKREAAAAARALAPPKAPKAPKVPRVRKASEKAEAAVEAAPGGGRRGSTKLVLKRPVQPQNPRLALCSAHAQRHSAVPGSLTTLSLRSEKLKRGLRATAGGKGA